ncbi:MAG: hypothetical protein AB7T18_14670, partial [Alphaproteobacteria bacterium]
MPFQLDDQDDPPKSFVLTAAGGYTPTAEEDNCLQRVRQFLTQLAGLTGDGTPRGAEIVLARNRCVEQLRTRAEEFVSGTITANDFLLTTFKYEGRLDERLSYIQSASIAINAYRDPSNPEIFVDIEYEISGGVTSKEQLDLKRGIDKAATVVKVI